METKTYLTAFQSSLAGGMFVKYFKRNNSILPEDLVENPANDGLHKTKKHIPPLKASVLRIDLNSEYSGCITAFVREPIF